MTEVPESRFQILDRNTGEEVDEQDFMKEYFSESRSEQRRGFEISYPYKMFKFLEAAGSGKVKVLIHLLKIKSSQNLIIGSSRTIAEDLGLAKNTVYAVMKKLQDEKLLVRVDRGVYLLNPDVMVYGGNNAWRARDVWDRQIRKRGQDNGPQTRMCSDDDS